MSSDRAEKIAEHIIATLVQVRKHKGLAVNKLAWMSGVSPSAIAFMENGTHSPTLKTFLRIASALDLDIAEVYRDADATVSADW